MSHVPMGATSDSGALAIPQAKAGGAVQALDAIGAVVSTLSRVCGALAAAAIMAMALMTAYDVLMRYVFNSPTSWATELSGYLLIFTAMFGAVYTMHEGGHIALVLVYGRLSRPVQIVVSIVAALMMLTYLAILTWNGLDMALTAFRQGGGHIGDMNMPQWMTYQIIPIGGALFGLEALRQFYGNIRDLQANRAATAVREL